MGLKDQNRQMRPLPDEAAAQGKGKKKRGKMHLSATLSACCLAVAVLACGVRASYAKFTASAESMPLSVQTGTFACDVQEIPISTISKADYGIDDEDVLVAAFSVSNEKDGRKSDVDLSVDVALTMTGTYNYHMKLDFPEDYPASQATTTLTDENGNKDKAVTDNATYCKGLKSNLIVGKMAGGVFQPVRMIESAKLPGISTMALPSVEQDVHVTVDVGNTWTDAATIRCSDDSPLVFLVVIDTEVLDASGTQLTYTGPDLALSGNMQGTDTRNLHVIVNQAQMG